MTIETKGGNAIIRAITNSKLPSGRRGPGKRGVRVP